MRDLLPESLSLLAALVAMDQMYPLTVKLAVPSGA